MDRLLRELQRAAATGDLQAQHRYLHTILRNPDVYRDIETRARWGEQDYVPLYLQLLDAKGEVDIDNLWVCPYAYQPYEFDYNRTTPLLSPFPYELGMNFESMMQSLRDAGEEIAVYPEEYADPPTQVINAYVVDVRDLELADKVERSMHSHTGNIDVDDYAVYLLSPWAAASFYVLQGAAVLEITRKGVHIPDSHDVSLPMPSNRRTRQYYQRAGYIPEPYYPFPRRESNSLLIGQPSIRKHNQPYVVMIHRPTFRGFILGGGYSVISDDAPEELMVHAMRYNQQVDYGYSGGHTWPEWTKGIPQSEFVGYWIAN